MIPAWLMCNRPILPPCRLSSLLSSISSPILTGPSPCQHPQDVHTRRPSCGCDHIPSRTSSLARHSTPASPDVSACCMNGSPTSRLPSKSLVLPACPRRC
ncbi:hypothetical protein BDW42DRAFT_94092 [Aspergillus taichungensis]|uniref:Uncharacterized protein n=1 Tax=Aspergillus taichungensis TaxID=482145 RepID=A0A2J5I8N0_9EURO|nr:hypothetical protein BDW42DRAFT_94092 [Aspergillus taichungensis]